MAPSPARSRRLSAAVSTKMTPDERGAVAKAAETSGLSLSEYARRELLKSATGMSPVERHLAGELAAHGSVLFELVKLLCADEDRVRGIVSAADAGRLRLAELRWGKFTEISQ